MPSSAQDVIQRDMARIRSEIADLEGRLSKIVAGAIRRGRAKATSVSLGTVKANE